MQADVTICGKEKHQQCAWSKGTAFQMKQSLPGSPHWKKETLSNYSQLQFKKRYKISIRQSAALEMRQPPGCVRGNAEMFMEVHLVFSCLQHTSPLSL